MHKRHFCFHVICLLFAAASLTPAHALTPQQLEPVSVIGHYNSSFWGMSGGGAGGGGGGPPRSPDETAPEGPDSSVAIMTNKITDVKCMNNAAYRSVTSRSDGDAREAAANAAISEFLGKNSSATLPMAILAFFTNRGPFRTGDQISVVFADNGSATYTINNPEGGTATIVHGSESNLVQGNGVPAPAACAVG